MSLLAFDIGGYSVKYGEWDKNLKETHSFKTPDTWQEMKDEMLRVFKSYEGIKGIALSTPGSFDREKGIITGISPVDYITDFDILSELESMFDLPIAIENDANSAARAELWQGVAQEEQNVIFVIIGSHINGALVAGGRLHRGHNLLGGEFGNMLLDKDHSFNDLVSPVLIGERYSLAKGKKKDAFSGKDVFDLAKKGDKDALTEVKKFYDYLAMALYNLQFTSDPAMIVIGGGVSQNKELIGELKKRIDKLLEKGPLKSLEINLKACHFLDEANLIGAIASFNHQKGGAFWDII